MPTIFKRPKSPFHQIRYVDRDGRARTTSSRVKDRRTAIALGNELEDRERAIREGRISPAELEARESAKRSIIEILDEHLVADRGRRLHPRHLAGKSAMLHRFFRLEKIDRLSQIDAAAIERHMRHLVDVGARLREDGRATRLSQSPVGDEESARPLSARSANAFRANVLRFLAWCVETRRLAAHPCPGRAVRKMNEDSDQRRLRRPFTEEELDRLFDSLVDEDRLDAYRLAFLTGLRRGELEALRWKDVDLDELEPCLRLRAEGTKSRRAEELPLHADAAAILARLRPEDADPDDRVMRSIPTVHRLYRDLADAGVQAVDGRRAVPDAGGRILDFHSFRATLATVLANRGVAPLHLKRIMRHASIETTDRHYTGLRLSDLGRELSRLGIDGVRTKVRTSVAPDGANRCDSVQATGTGDEIASRSEAVLLARLGDDSRGDASKRAKGLEPSTFSLEGRRDRADSSGESRSRRSSAHQSAHLARAEALGRLHAALADLPVESLEILISVASSMGSSTSPARRHG